MTQKPSHLIEYAREMRKNQTPSEQKLWQHLRSKRFGGIKFRCQHPIPPYIVDFFCASARLIIELDGESHEKKWQYDTKRQEFLEKQGFTVLRFWDCEVYENLAGILEVIELYCRP